ncbi:MAG: hypothetical protein AABY88_02230 [Pseudomonadota bacterium]
MKFDVKTVSDLPAFVDIRSLQCELSMRPEFSKLNKIIARALFYQSCRADLAQAETCVVALKQLLNSPRKAGTLEKLATESALLMQAALLYERATAGNGGRGQRGSLAIAGKLSPDLLADHELIVNLRNRGIAHVYHGEIIGQKIWSEQTILLIEQDSGFRPCVTTRTSQVSLPIINALERLLPVASELAKSKTDEQLDKLIETLNQNPIGIDMMSRHRVDPTKFFESEERALEVVKSSSRGEASFRSN